MMLYSVILEAHCEGEMVQPTKQELRTTAPFLPPVSPQLLLAQWLLGLAQHLSTECLLNGTTIRWRWLWLLHPVPSLKVLKSALTVTPSRAFLTHRTEELQQTCLLSLSLRGKTNWLHLTSNGHFDICVSFQHSSLSSNNCQNLFKMDEIHF